MSDLLWSETVQLGFSDESYQRSLICIDEPGSFLKGCGQVNKTCNEDMRILEHEL